MATHAGDYRWGEYIGHSNLARSTAHKSRYYRSFGFDFGKHRNSRFLELDGYGSGDNAGFASASATPWAEWAIRPSAPILDPPAIRGGVSKASFPELA